MTILSNYAQDANRFSISQDGYTEKALSMIAELRSCFHEFVFGTKILAERSHLLNTGLVNDTNRRSILGDPAGDSFTLFVAGIAVLFDSWYSGCALETQ